MKAPKANLMFPSGSTLDPDGDLRYLIQTSPKLYGVLYGNTTDAAYRAHAARFPLGIYSATAAAADMNDIKRRNPRQLMLIYFPMANPFGDNGGGGGVLGTGTTPVEMRLKDGSGTLQTVNYPGYPPNYIADYRVSQWQTLAFNQIRTYLLQYPWAGVFFDNCTARLTAQLAVDPTGLAAALKSVIYIFRREFPNHIFIGNCFERWLDINGKMCENRSSDWATELVAPFGKGPRIDLAEIDTYSTVDDAAITTDMNNAHALGAWFGAADGHYNTTFFPSVFQTYINSGRWG